MEITRPQSLEDFRALDLSALWYAIVGVVDQGWDINVYVMVIPKRAIWLNLSCSASRVGRPALGPIVDAIAPGGWVAEIVVHCGCGECNDGGGGFRMLPIRV